MNADVDKFKDEFLNKINDLYNQEVYFLASCYRFPDKYSLNISTIDSNLRIFFEENNKITIAGKCLKYCDKASAKRKIKLADISSEVDVDINIVNNYVLDDKWEQTDW